MWAAKAAAALSGVAVGWGAAFRVAFVVVDFFVAFVATFFTVFRAAFVVVFFLVSWADAACSSRAGVSIPVLSAATCYTYVLCVVARRSTSRAQTRVCALPPRRKGAASLYKNPSMNLSCRRAHLGNPQGTSVAATFSLLHRIGLRRCGAMCGRRLYHTRRAPRNGMPRGARRGRGHVVTDELRESAIDPLSGVGHIAKSAVAEAAIGATARRSALASEPGIVTEVIIISSPTTRRVTLG